MARRSCTTRDSSCCCRRPPVHHHIARSTRQWDNSSASTFQKPRTRSRSRYSSQILLCPMVSTRHSLARTTVTPDDNRVIAVVTGANRRVDLVYSIPSSCWIWHLADRQRLRSRHMSPAPLQPLIPARHTYSGNDTTTIRPPHIAAPPPRGRVL